MSIRNLTHIKKFFEGADNPEEKKELYKEVLLMTLSRATRADLVTDDSEVSTVQSAILEATGEEVTAKCVRIAAASELYETAPIDKYLSRVGQKIDLSQRQAIVESLIKVFKSDGQVTESETDFFNMVVGALKLSPAEAAGLVAS